MTTTQQYLSQLDKQLEFIDLSPTSRATAVAPIAFLHTSRMWQTAIAHRTDECAIYSVFDEVHQSSVKNVIALHVHTLHGAVAM